MSRIVLVTDTPSTVQLVNFATGGECEVLDGSAEVSAAGVIASTSDGRPPLVVILDLGTARAAEAVRIAEELHRSHGVSTIVMDAQPDLIGLAALRAGVRDIVAPDVEMTQLRETIENSAQLALALQLSRREDEQRQAIDEGTKTVGKIVTVASPKGGVGKTTIATNVAVGLAQRFPGRVVIVDLDIHYGDVASALNLEPEYTLPDCVRGPARVDVLALKSLLTQHVTTLYAIPGSEDPGDADLVSAEDCARLLQMLRQEFDFVVVDTAPGLGDHVLAALDQSNELVLVTGLDVPGVRGMVKEMATLGDLHLLLDSRHLVVNFEDRNRGMTVKDVEAALREDVDVILPMSTAVPLSVNQGVPLVQSGSRDMVARQLVRLVERLAPVFGTAKPAKKGLFGIGASK